VTQQEYKRTLYLLNREDRLAQMKRYYAANRERLIEYQRLYRLKKKAVTSA
jgi:hypothetical protein